MGSDEDIILAINKELLFKDNYFEGFKPASEVNFYERLIQHNIHMNRGEAEKSPTHKHPIAYLLVISPSFKVFAYQRSQKGNESRLHGNWSWGVGGHVDKKDTESPDPIPTSLLRELREELVGAENPTALKLLGYINDDQNDVGKVHFGLLYAVRVDSEDVKFKASEIKEGSLQELSKIEEICSSSTHNVENWSRIALDPLRNYILESRRKNMAERHKAWPLFKRA